MRKLKYEVWNDASDKRFIVLPNDEFARTTELLEDRRLSGILRKAKRSDTGKPGIPFAEVKRQLGIQRRKKS